MRQNVNGAASLRIDAGVIRDEANVLAAKRRELLRFENVETGLHTRRVSCAFRRARRPRGSKREKRNKDREMDEREMRALESAQKIPPHPNHPIIFLNPLPKPPFI